jgi:hypothetical protein
VTRNQRVGPTENSCSSSTIINGSREPLRFGAIARLSVTKSWKYFGVGFCFVFILYVHVFNGSCIFEYLPSFDRGMLQTPKQVLNKWGGAPITNPVSENL